MLTTIVFALLLAGAKLEGVLREFFLHRWEHVEDGATDANSYAVLCSDWHRSCKANLEAKMGFLSR